MVSLYVNDAGLTGVAGQLAAQAQRLAALAATPPVHSALAVDEVSTSASARLTEHGAVMASRAADAAEVMRSAAMAVQEMATAYGQMDRRQRHHDVVAGRVGRRCHTDIHSCGDHQPRGARRADRRGTLP